MILASRKSIKLDLLAYGEIELAAKIDELSDKELNVISVLAARYLDKGHNLYSKVIALGAIEFFEGAFRETKNRRRNMQVYKNDEPEDKS